ncbi:hypothetical protein EVAR_52469_1 [Eumeta japonica]|uniref:Uncharacterized protein n=1 Tax=Eumeta variegata TaxID=151549 RepID=A0A4C1Z209_EUMVA|nr:hypothetical protein EVAR_52469_1 [Eumeta japonica]
MIEDEPVVETQRKSLTCGSDSPDNLRFRECDRRREYFRHLVMKRFRGRASRPRWQTQAALRGHVLPNARAVRRAAGATPRTGLLLATTLKRKFETTWMYTTTKTMSPHL